MAEAIFRHGKPISIDYTPTAGNVSAGQVVVLGNTTGPSCGIAHLDITNNTLGTLFIGNGIYTCVNLNNAANYVKVYWDDTNNKVTTTSTSMQAFGYVVEDGGGGANTNCKVLHWPYP